MSKTVAKISVGVVLVLALAGAILIYGVFSVVEVLTPSSYSITLTTKPEVTSKSWIVFDVELGDILHSHNADEVLPIASVTKLFTASQFYSNADLNANTTIVWGDVITDGRSGKLSYGEEYTNRELLFPLLLESSNDAATALHRVHSTLLDDMNSYMTDLKLEHTSFSDTSGLSSKNVSTARELGVVSRNVYMTQPQIFDITRISAYYSEDNGWINNNPYVEDESYMGGKHGFTYDAGRTAVAFFDEQINGGTKRTIGYVLLGSEDLTTDMELLRDYMWQNTTYK